MGFVEHIVIALALAAANEKGKTSEGANRSQKSSIIVMLYCLLPFYVDNNHLL